MTDFTDTLEQIREWQPHLLLLDINLPGEDGFRICSGIRTFSAAPIIFVTSRNTDMDELNSIMPVSYTHLDVYKRQALYRFAGGGRDTAGELLYIQCGMYAFQRVLYDGKISP